MAILLDTNVLLRLADSADPLYPVADRAVIELRRRGEQLRLTAQNMVEFRNVDFQCQRLRPDGVLQPRHHCRRSSYGLDPYLPTLHIGFC